jgi:hypothetical protein
MKGDLIMIPDNTILGSVFISESVDIDASNDDAKRSTGFCNLVQESAGDNSGIGVSFITFDTNLQDFDVQNRNHRYYSADNIWECIQSEKIQSLLRTGGWFGEFDHPAPERADEKLSPQRIQNVPPKYRAFKIMSPHLEGNVLKAKIQSAQGTVGEGFAKEVLAGWIPQFSARAIASMISKNGKPYVQVRRLITYDAPWYPSHEIAHATSAPEVRSKAFTESVHETINNAKDRINGILIPLKDILTDIGKTDINVQTVMESFDIGMESLVGVSDNHKQAIIKDDMNTIYCNINPDTAKKVDDFFASF